MVRLGIAATVRPERVHRLRLTRVLVIFKCWIVHADGVGRFMFGRQCNAVVFGRAGGRLVGGRLQGPWRWRRCGCGRRRFHLDAVLGVAANGYGDFVAERCRRRHMIGLIAHY